MICSEINVQDVNWLWNRNSRSFSLFSCICKYLLRSDSSSTVTYKQIFITLSIAFSSHNYEVTGRQKIHILQENLLCLPFQRCTLILIAYTGIETAWITKRVLKLYILHNSYKLPFPMKGWILPSFEVPPNLFVVFF